LAGGLGHAPGSVAVRVAVRLLDGCEVPDCSFDGPFRRFDPFCEVYVRGHGRGSLRSLPKMLTKTQPSAMPSVSSPSRGRSMKPRLASAAATPIEMNVAQQN